MSAVSVLCVSSASPRRDKIESIPSFVSSVSALCLCLFEVDILDIKDYHKHSDNFRC